MVIANEILDTSPITIILMVCFFIIRNVDSQATVSLCGMSQCEDDAQTYQLKEEIDLMKITLGPHLSD